MSDFSVAGSEQETLLGAFDRIRRTFAWKCGGLDATAMRTTLGPSTLTLGGLVKHLALCEDYYFTGVLAGRPLDARWKPARDDPDRVWRSAADHTPDELMTIWRDAVDRSRSAITDALAREGLDTPAAQPVHGDVLPNLRRLVVDMNEEYARHTGHADLIRESIDGLVGEDAPS